MTEQLNQQQAINFYHSRIWESWTDEEIVKLQLFQDLLCVPFSRFHEAIDNVFGRPVFTHEFMDKDSLIKEYLKEKPAPTLKEIISMIPIEKVSMIFNN